jgi:hypothetical protein
VGGLGGGQMAEGFRSGFPILLAREYPCGVSGVHF